MTQQISLQKERQPEFGKVWLHPCALHPEPDFGPEQIDEVMQSLACPDCGKMLQSDWCSWCGAGWIVYGDSVDDVIADASVTSSGDLVCCECAEQIEEDDLEEAAEDWADDWSDDQ